MIRHGAFEAAAGNPAGSAFPVTEPELIRERYARRNRAGKARLYDILDPWVLLPVQEKERALVRWVRACGIEPVGERRVLEVGCGTGDDLLQFLRLGFSPENLSGYELLPERASVARRRLPEATTVVCGDASEADFEDASFDIVSHSTVFSSILDPAFQEKLAARLWALARPGGGILWYDFLYDNPRNRDVRGVSKDRVRALFPEGEARFWRISLAPPLGRPLGRLHPLAYTLANQVRPLRVAVLGWVAKPQMP
jgi:SAM-dependent methyltransferase